MPSPDPLDTLQQHLDRLRNGSATVAPLATWVHAQPSLCEGLPDRFQPVLHGLIDRLESGALFSQESCSFSQDALVDSLQQWIDAARASRQRSQGGPG